MALLKLDPNTGAILQEYGDGLTQSAAIAPATGLIYVSSGNGIEIFDPITEKFTHYSDLRVGNLAFAPDGSLWAARWPQRGEIVRFNAENQAELMLDLDKPIDSLAFGQEETKLAGLLFISSNNGDLLMFDLATKDYVTVASGGSRGDIVRTTASGRVLLSQSQQIDIFTPAIAPIVAATNPAPDSTIALPQGQIAVTFDQDMNLGDAGEITSVLNPVNFTLIGEAIGTIKPASVSYDAATRTAVLDFGAISPDRYQLLVESDLQSADGINMEADYTVAFTAISDFSALVDIQFTNSRYDRKNQTLAFDAAITNKTSYDLELPLMLMLEIAPALLNQSMN